VVPPQARAEMLFGGAAGFAGFAVLGLFTAVTPGLLALLGHRNPALTGSVVFVVFVGSAVGQGLSSVLALRLSLLLGTALLAVGAVVVAVAIGSSSLGVLLLAATVAGFGQGLSFRAALGAVTAASPATERGAVASTFFAICYVGLSLPVVAIGVGIEEYGLVRAGEVFAGVVAAVAVVALLRLARDSGGA
jgi:sugar phosphate permease